LLTHISMGQTSYWMYGWAVCADGSIIHYQPVVENTADTKEKSPSEIALSQNYPNPFNPTTSIRYEVPVGTRHAVSLQVFDVMGRLVATLVNEMKEPGTYVVQWDASGMASGVYLCRVEADGFTGTRKLMLLR